MNHEGVTGAARAVPGRHRRGARRALAPHCRRVLAAACLAAAAAAQEHAFALLPVGDLLQPDASAEPYLATAALRGRRLLRGEEAWLHLECDYEARRQLLRPCSRPWFGPGDLDALVEQLLQQDGDRIEVIPPSQLAVRGGLGDVVQQVLTELRQRLPPAVRVDLQVVRLDPAGEQLVLARSLDCMAGRRRWASAVQESSVVAGYGVEIAQGAQIGNPMPLRIGQGVMVVLRPFVSTLEPEAWFESIVRVVEPGDAEAIDTGETSCGPLDRAHERVREVAAIVQVSLGGKVRQRWQGPDGTPYELRMTPTWQVPAPARPGGHDVEYVPCWSDFTGFRSEPYAELERGDDDPSVAEADFRATLAAAGVSTHDTGGGVAVFGVDKEAEQLRALVRTRHLRARPVSVHLAAYDAPAGKQLGDDGAPAEARLLADMRLQTVFGSWATATAYEELTVATDWDVEVAQSSRIPQPRFERLAAGLFMNLRCSDDAVEVDGELSWRAPLDGRRYQLARAVDAPGEARAVKAGESAVLQEVPPTHLPREAVSIEHAPVQRLPLLFRQPLRRDQPSVWRCTSALLPAGRELVVTVRRVD
jgi:hypothetical protein